MALLGTLTHTANDAAVVIDHRSVIVHFNSAAERMFGHTSAEAVGKNVSLLMPEPYKSEHRGYIDRYEDTGVSYAIGKIRRVTGRRKSGECFPIELSVTRLTETEGARYGAVIRDISAQTRSNEELLERERLATVGTMAAMLVHEIGNPINNIYLTVQMLERLLRKQPDSKLGEGIQTCLTEMERISRLLDDFRALSHKASFDFQPCDVRELIDQVIYQRLPPSGVVVTRHIASPLPEVSLDRDRIAQVLLNLIRNSYEAMPNGGELRVSASRAEFGISTDRIEPGVCVSVADTGCGVPEDLPIFDAFVTTKAQGTGLGLPISKQITSAHGGSLAYVTSKTGTTFSLTLPLQPPSATAY